MAHDIYQNGRKVGQLLTPDEAYHHETGAIIGSATKGVWNISPLAFIATAWTWLAVTARTEPFLSHPYIWGGLIIITIASFAMGNWAIVFLFLPFTIDYFFPGYYWIGLGLLWLAMVAEASGNTEEAKKAAAIAAAGSTPANAGPPPKGCPYFEPIDCKIQISSEGVSAIISCQFTNPFDKAIATADCSLNVLNANNEVFLESHFPIQDFAPKESATMKVETNAYHQEKPIGKALIANSNPHIIYKVMKFTFTDGTTLQTKAPHFTCD